MSFMTDEPLAVFDLDGTLIRGDSLLPFLIYLGKKQKRWSALAQLPVDLMIYAIKWRGDQATKQLVMKRFLQGLSWSQVNVCVETFLEQWLPRQLLSNTVCKLKEHQAAGHRVILLSASPNVYVPAIAQRLGINEVVCTQVALENDAWQGTIIGENCKGKAKLRMLQEYLQSSQTPNLSFAYGDQRSDLPVLEWVTNGYLLKKGQFLKVAIKR